MLTEMMVAVAISSLLLIVIALLSHYSTRSFAAMTNYADLDRYSRIALDRMSEDIRQTRALTAYSSTNLTFIDDDGQPLSFVFDGGARALKRIKGGQEKVLLKECDLLQFEMFQRNPVPGQFSVYPTASPASCKLVQITWTCSRTFLGAKWNTESVQSAKIVIRKLQL